MIFREPTHELLDSTFRLFDGHDAQGDGLFGFGPDPALTGPSGDASDASGDPSGDGSSSHESSGGAEESASDDDLWPGEKHDAECGPGEFPFQSDAGFIAMFEQMRREISEDPFHAGHCLFAHVALRGLAFADPLRVVRLLREEPQKMTRGAMLYASRVAPPVVATTLFRYDEVLVYPLDLPGWTGALIVMPPPTQPSGVHFAAALVPAQATEDEALDRFEYITLEESLELNGEFATTLGRRLANEKYVEVGPGPDVDRAAFVEAVQALIATPRESGTPAPTDQATTAAPAAPPGGAPRPKPSQKSAVA